MNNQYIDQYLRYISIYQCSGSTQVIVLIIFGHWNNLTCNEQNIVYTCTIYIYTYSHINKHLKNYGFMFPNVKVK